MVCHCSNFCNQLLSAARNCEENIDGSVKRTNQMCGAVKKLVNLKAYFFPDNESEANTVRLLVLGLRWLRAT
jgi:hypothetical protein